MAASIVWPKVRNPYAVAVRHQVHQWFRRHVQQIQDLLAAAAARRTPAIRTPVGWNQVPYRKRASSGFSVGEDIANVRDNAHSCTAMVVGGVPESAGCRRPRRPSLSTSSGE